VQSTDSNEDDVSRARAKTVKEILSFVEEYGSYLKLHTCLAYSAVVKADSVISSLLDVAKHDPNHKEMMKHTCKPGSLVFYEPVCPHAGADVNLYICLNPSSHDLLLFVAVDDVVSGSSKASEPSKTLHVGAVAFNDRRLCCSLPRYPSVAS